MGTQGVALITGASMGLGREFARLFAADRIDVVLVARSEGKLRELATEIEKAHGVRAHVVAADLTDPAAPDRIRQATDQAGLQVDYLVNNAGFGTNGPFVELDLARETEELQVNIVALMKLTRLYLPDMVQRRRGRILNIASTAGFQPGPLMANYYASKAYVVSFSEAIAVELAGTGVTVTAHCPGATATEFARTAGNDRSLLFKLGAANAATVARHGYRAMHAGKVVAIQGPLNWLVAQSIRFTPRALVRWLARRVNS